MSDLWTIMAAGRVYGPFSTERMRGFVAEGRLAANSLVAREGSSEWQEAVTESAFADLFCSPHRATDAVEPETTAATGDTQRGHFAVVVDMKSRSAAGLEGAIAAFGPCYQLLPNIWIVSTDQSVTTVRNRLIQELGNADSLFVIDASRGKASWFNFGPEADVRIRNVWQKAS